MNRKLIFAVAAASALLLSSCRKADEVTPSESHFDELEFTATIDGPSTKTTVNTNKDSDYRGKIEWEKGDTITITDANKTSVVYVTEEGDGIFRKKAGQAGRLAYSSTYSAIYGTAPADTQKYEYHYLKDTLASNVYMTTGEKPVSGRNLTFTAACGLLKIVVRASSDPISRIDVSGKIGGIDTTYTLTCGEGVSISKGDTGVFYLTLPEGSYNRMVFYNKKNKSCEKQYKDDKGNDLSMDIKDNMIQPVTIKDVTFAEFYPGTELEGIKIGDVTWAPVNCGYDASHTYGLLYQWGRMYGQDYDAETITPETLTKDQGEDPANSSKFGMYNNTNYNWFSGDLDNALWNGSTKGTYDPCPSGWRVPTEAELSALISNKAWGTNTVGGVEQTGYWFNGSSAASGGTGVFLPVAGYRTFDYGSAYDRGYYGYYWSSSVNGNYTWRLSFRDGRADMYYYYRAYGYSVRCVQE